MNEIWKDIVGYEGLYQVSNLGRIKSLSRFKKCGKENTIGYIKPECILKPNKQKSGYCYITLKGKQTKFTTIHRLVAQAFIPNPNDYPCVNHKDENKSNNNVYNLEWCTKAYNNSYNNKDQRCCKPVLQYDLNGNFIKEWKSAREVYNVLKIQYKNISKCCKGERNKAGGYIWKFKDKGENYYEKI